MNRTKQLEEFLREDPDDPFNSYALALEYLKTNPEQAYTLFQKLFEYHPGYLPTYYPYAHLLIERKETEKAEEVFRAGMRKATAEGDSKTHRELQAAYNDWLFQRE